mgnify:CR=1 FL=1
MLRLLLICTACNALLAPAPARRRGAALHSSSSSNDVWQAMNVIDLKAACRRRGLKVSGNKAELVARLAVAPESQALVVSSQLAEPVLEEPSLSDVRVGFVDSSVREEHELDVGGAKIKCYTTALKISPHLAEAHAALAAVVYQCRVHAVANYTARLYNVNL